MGQGKAGQSPRKLKYKEIIDLTGDSSEEEISDRKHKRRKVKSEPIAVIDLTGDSSEEISDGKRKQREVKSEPIAVIDLTSEG